MGERAQMHPWAFLYILSECHVFVVHAISSLTQYLLFPYEV